MTGQTYRLPALAEHGSCSAGRRAVQYPKHLALALFKGGFEVAPQAGAMDAAGIVSWAKSKS